MWKMLAFVDSGKGKHLIVCVQAFCVSFMYFVWRRKIFLIPLYFYFVIIDQINFKPNFTFTTKNCKI